MTDIYVALCYLAWVIGGLVAPFVFGLGYVWVDTFYPQEQSRLLAGQPVSLLMALFTIVGYFGFDRRYPPKLDLMVLLLIGMAIWVTVTTQFVAVAGDFAWQKWDWAFKTLVFSALIPFVFRTRVQIEAFLHAYLFGLAANITSAGIKTAMGGGGYGRSLTIGGGTLTESSTLACVSLMIVPILLYLCHHSLLIKDQRMRLSIYGGYTATCLLAAVGTTARTAIIGFGVLAIIMWLQSKRKVLFGCAILLVGSLLLLSTSDTWKERMSTIENPTDDSSANNRILVWKWTLDYVSSHPFGGGFNSYVLNRLNVSEGSEGFAVAFHSAYFEMLGEHGWIGLSIFSLLIACTFLRLYRLKTRATGDPEISWCSHLARSMLGSLIILMACADFIGVAFQPMFWYIFATTCSLHQYHRRMVKLVSV